MYINNCIDQPWCCHFHGQLHLRVENFQSGTSSIVLMHISK